MSTTKLTTYCTRNQVRSQVSRFGGAQYIFLGGTIFAFTICLKQIFLCARKFGEAQKKFRGALPPNAPPWLRACTKLYKAFRQLHCRLAANFRIISPLDSAFMILRWFGLANICFQVSRLHRSDKFFDRKLILHYVSSVLKPASNAYE